MREFRSLDIQYIRDIKRNKFKPKNIMNKPRNSLMNEKREIFSDKKADAEMTKRADHNLGGKKPVNAVITSKH